jgi:hypothetical protein
MLMFPWMLLRKDFPSRPAARVEAFALEELTLKTLMQAHLKNAHQEHIPIRPDKLNARTAKGAVNVNTKEVLPLVPHLAQTVPLAPDGRRNATSARKGISAPKSVFLTKAARLQM